MLRVFEGQGDRGGDDHHSGDGANSEDQQIGDGPVGIANGGEHEQGDGGRAGESVDEADKQRANGLIEAELAEDAIHPADRGGCFGVAVLFGIVGVRVGVNVISVDVWMHVRVQGVRRRRELFRDPACKAREIQDSKQDEHQADANSMVRPRRGWDDDSEEDDGRAYQKNRDGMADAPQRANHRGVEHAALTADDGGYGDDVIGVRGVAHAEEKAEGDDGD